MADEMTTTLPQADAPAGLVQDAVLGGAAGRFDKVVEFIVLGGPAIWAIAAVSVVALALILWKVWRLAIMGAWIGGGHARRAVELWAQGDEDRALAQLQGRRTCRGGSDPRGDGGAARCDTGRGCGAGRNRACGA